MENIPREIVNIIIGYFRGYENKDKKILGLGEKEEYICNIMNHKLMEITKYEDKIWDELIDKEKEKILINTDKLLKGETIHKEEIKYKYFVISINLWFIILHIYSSFSPSPNIFLSLFSYPLKYPIIIFTISLGIFSIFSYILSKILIQIYFIHLDHFHD